MTARNFLESKGIFSLDTQKRTKEVLAWMEEYAQMKVNELNKSDVIKSVCDHNKMSRQKEIVCTCDKCGHKWFTE